MNFTDFSADVQASFQRGDDQADFAFYPFDQMRIAERAGLTVRTDSGDLFANETRGFCSTACLIFIRNRQAPKFGTYDDIFGDKLFDEGFIMRMHRKHRSSYENPVKAISTADVTTKTKSQSYGLKLNSVSDIVEEVFSRQALYYVAFRNKLDTGGHAVAFDTRGPAIFFDPNSGWWEARNNPTAVAFFKAWFPKYYTEAGYRVPYHHGDRWVIRYT